MKRVLIIMLSISLVFLSAAAAQALLRKDIVPVEGVVILKSEAQRVLTIKEQGSGAVVSFKANEQQLGRVQEGDRVILMHALDSQDIRYINVLK